MSRYVVTLLIERKTNMQTIDDVKKHCRVVGEGIAKVAFRLKK